MSFHVGDEVIVQVGHGHAARDVAAFVRFKGRAEFAAGTWLGLELCEAAGRNDGTVSGVDYFDCRADHGLFLKNHSAQVRRAPSAVEAEKRRGHDAYHLSAQGVPRSPRRERREAEAATRMQSNFRGMKDRTEIRVKQRIDAWDELDMADEIDFLQKHRDNASVGRCAAQLGHEAAGGEQEHRVRSPNKLARTTTARLWVESADRAPPPPPADYRGPTTQWPLTDADVLTMVSHFRREPTVPLCEHTKQSPPQPDFQKHL